MNLLPCQVSLQSMHSTSVYGLKLSVLRGVGAKALATNHRVFLNFREVRLESKWNATFWVFSTGSFRQQQNIWKGSPVFPDGIFQTEIRVPFLQSIFDTSFRPSRPSFGKWNWFAQMVKAIPGRNLLVLNSANHLTTPWTEWFARVNGKQPCPRNTRLCLSSPHALVPLVFSKRLKGL